MEQTNTMMGGLAAVLVFLIPLQVFWPYFAGTAALATGLRCKRKILRQSRGVEGLMLLGPVFVAVAMAVFGADHLATPKLVSLVVPVWMPWRLFWAIFVGIALIAAALSLATGIQSTLATCLLGVMIFLFVPMIYLPWWLAAPADRMRLTLVLRDLTLSWAYLAFAAGAPRPTAAEDVPGLLSPRLRSGVVSTARFIIAIAIGFYGLEQFLNPEAAPGIPPDGPSMVTMPAWVPGHVFWSYLTGAIFVFCAMGLLSAKYARRAATILGVTTCVLILIAYIPLTIAKPSDIENGLNYLAIHFALAGAMLVLSAAIPEGAR